MSPSTVLAQPMRHAGAIAAIATLAACASHPKPAPAPTPPPPAAAPAARPAARPGPPPSSVSTAPLPGSERDFVVNVGDRVYFEYDKFDIRPDAEALLTSQAAWLIRYPAVQIRIEGNADERGTEEYNLALGARRANAVKEFLQAHGVASGRISTVSYGKEKPIDTGTSEEAMAHNRNGHTAILSGAR
ncbi:MAG: peptidoglycan-associated lipoprotein Pal [Phenylobacterium sp.]